MEFYSGIAEREANIMPPAETTAITIPPVKNGELCPKYWYAQSPHDGPKTRAKLLAD